MNGRIEEEIRVENKIKKYLKGQPNILKDYYNSFMDETYNTKYNYINHVIGFIDFIDKEYGIDFRNTNKIKEVKAMHINSFIKNFTYKKNMEKNSNTYISNKLSALRNFFDFLCNNDFIEYNPCTKVKMPKDNRIRSITYLTEDEIKIIENNIINGVGSNRALSYQKKWINRDMAIVVLGITTGLRVSAICNINIEDINFDNKTIRVVEKGNIEKDVYVPEKTLELLNKWICDRNKIIKKSNNVNALFLSNQIKRINQNTIRIMLKKYTYNINKNITPHKLRSTTATNLLSHTDDIYLVAEVLGHKNLQNTRRYAQMSNERKVNAANILGNLV